MKRLKAGPVLHEGTGRFRTVITGALLLVTGLGIFTGMLIDLGAISAANVDPDRALQAAILHAYRVVPTLAFCLVIGYGIARRLEQTAKSVATHYAPLTGDLNVEVTYAREIDVINAYVARAPSALADYASDRWHQIKTHLLRLRDVIDSGHTAVAKLLTWFVGVLAEDVAVTAARANPHLQDKDPAQLITAILDTYPPSRIRYRGPA